MNDHTDGGLQEDLALIARNHQLARRRLLGWLAGGSAAALIAGCGGGEESAAASTGSATSGSTTTTTTTTTGTSSSACTVPATETEGPYPSDGSNAVNGSTSNVLAQSGVVRSDIRASFGGSSTVAAGVPLTLALKLVNARSNCAPLAGYVVYLWQCDRDGNYSLYASSLRNDNYLRGVQVSDSSGLVTFQTIFPGCYAGRWPHIHFEIYPTIASATSYVNKALTSQLALPASDCATVYSTASGYSRSATNLTMVSLATDGIFADNSAAQMAVMTPALTGDITAGYSATTTIGINA
ncbi:MAG: intradiol ring-cleavage dioxygenase [Steroidobacteraceae bacterium]